MSLPSGHTYRSLGKKLSGLFANFEKSGTAGECLPVTNMTLKNLETMNLIDVPTTDPQDDFQCTYFRKQINRKLDKKNFFSWSGDNPLTSDLSDNCSDSDNESDNTTSVIRWLKSLPIDEEMYDVEDNSSSSGTTGVLVNDKSSDLDISVGPSQKKKSKLVFTHKKERVSTEDTLKTDSKELSIDNNEDISTTKRYAKTIDGRKTLKNTDILTSQNETFLLKSDSLNKNDENVKKDATKSFIGKLESRLKENFTKTRIVKDKRFLVRDQRLSMDESSTNNSLIVQNYDEPNIMLETMNELSTTRIEHNEESAKKAIEEKSKTSTTREKSRKYILQNRSPISTKSPTRQQRSEFNGTRKKSSCLSRNVQIIDNQKAKQRSEITKRSVVKSTREETLRNMRIFPECQQRKRSVQKVRFAFTNRSNVDEDPTRCLRINGTKLCCTGKSEYSGKIQEVKRKEMKKQCPIAQKKLIKLKMVKNECLLRKMKNIIDCIETTTNPYGQKAFQVTSELLQDDQNVKIETCNGDTVQRKIVKVAVKPVDTRSSISEEKEKINKRLSTQMENQTIDTRVSRRPIFRNPEVERNLDSAMEKALNKYKRSHKTWESLIENNSFISHEPPVKKQKS